jgi:hypothetical protein
MHLQNTVVSTLVIYRDRKSCVCTIIVYCPASHSLRPSNMLIPHKVPVRVFKFRHDDEHRLAQVRKIHRCGTTCLMRSWVSAFVTQPNPPPSMDVPRLKWYGRNPHIDIVRTLSFGNLRLHKSSNKSCHCRHAGSRGALLVC